MELRIKIKASEKVKKSEKNKKEVIDGQQRLLSIIAFTGKQYRHEED